MLIWGGGLNFTTKTVRFLEEFRMATVSASSVSASAPLKDKITVRNHPLLTPPPDIASESFPVKLVDYHPRMLLPNLSRFPPFSFIDIYIESKWLCWENPAVYERRLWGTDIYTDDSDIVAGNLFYHFYTSC